MASAGREDGGQTPSRALGRLRLGRHPTTAEQCKEEERDEWFGHFFSF